MAEPAVATLVVGAAVSRIDALAIIALACDTIVTGAGTADAHVILPSGARADVLIPKFGDPPPFAIDVSTDAGDDAARTAALELQIALENSTAWPMRRDF